MNDTYEVDKEDILEMKELLRRMYIDKLELHQEYIFEMAIIINRIIKENEIEY